MAITIKTPSIYIQIGHKANIGIRGFRNLGIEGILSILIF
jgi:hypothetical protein